MILQKMHYGRQKLIEYRSSMSDIQNDQFAARFRLFVRNDSLRINAPFEIAKIVTEGS